ncbi:MAG: thioredoxin [Oscillospiraceae bacterium]
MSIITATKENFQNEVLSAQQTVLIDFWAPWCGPCRMLSPIVDQLAEELGDAVKVCKVNVDEQGELAAQFRVMGIPMLAVMKNGKLMNTAVGVQPKKAIAAMLEG